MLFIQNSLNQTLATQIEPLKDQLRQVLEVVTPLSVTIQDLVEFKNKILNQLAEHSSRVLILEESNRNIETSIKTLNTQLANHKLNSNAVPQLKEKLAAQASALKDLTSQVELEKQLNISKFKNLNTEFIKITSEKECEVLGTTKDDVNFLQASQESLVDRMAKLEMTKTPTNINNIQSQLMELKSKIMILANSNQFLIAQINSNKGHVSSNTITPTSEDLHCNNKIVDSHTLLIMDSNGSKIIPDKLN